MAEENRATFDSYFAEKERLDEEKIDTTMRVVIGALGWKLKEMTLDHSYQEAEEANLERMRRQPTLLKRRLAAYRRC